MRDLFRRIILILAAAGLTLSASGCREDERGRPLTKQKGVYEGKADEKLDDQQRSDLRLRAAGQKF